MILRSSHNVLAGETSIFGQARDDNPGVVPTGVEGQNSLALGAVGAFKVSVGPDRVRDDVLVKRARTRLKLGSAVHEWSRRQDLNPRPPDYKSRSFAPDTD